MAWRLDEAKIERRRLERERADIAAMDAIKPEHGLCYFIGCDEGLVKIGWSKNVPQRLNRLKSGAIYKLSLLATARGGRARERHYHRKFSEHAVGGEWFTRCPEIEAEIKRLNVAPASAVTGSEGLTTEQGALNG